MGGGGGRQELCVQQGALQQEPLHLRLSWQGHAGRDHLRHRGLLGDPMALAGRQISCPPLLAIPSIPAACWAPVHGARMYSTSPLPPEEGAGASNRRRAAL